MNRKQIPIGVKIIAIIDYLLAGISLLGGIGLFVFTEMFTEIFGSIGAGGIIFSFLGGAFFLGLSVFLFFVGRGLEKTKNWARITNIIIALIGAITSLYNIIYGKFTSIISLIIYCAIGGYLLFNKEVKQIFSNSV